MAVTGPSDGSYSLDALITEAEEACGPEYLSYTGEPSVPEGSGLGVVVPDQADWRADIRVAECIVFKEEGFIGTIAGTT